MRRANVVEAIAIAFLMVLSLSMGFGCDEQGVFDPTLPVIRDLVFISSLEVERSIIRTGGDTTGVTAALVDKDNNPAPNRVVRFSTNLGIITPSAPTDFAGIAKATFTSSNTSGVAMVTAKVDSIRATVTIQIQESKAIP